MTLLQILDRFAAASRQCNALISNAHQMDVNGEHLLPQLDREQISSAALLNLFLSWEAFLESSFVSLMLGYPTISGTSPTRFVCPQDEEHAKRLLVGWNRYFDFGNLDIVRKIAPIYFRCGYPFEPHLGSVYSELQDMRTMRNASAHLTSTTQAALESLALRVFGEPRPGIVLYELLTSIDPRSETGGTIFSEYKIKLEAAADLIAQG